MAGVWGAWESITDLRLEGMQKRVNSEGPGYSNPGAFQRKD